MDTLYVRDFGIYPDARVDIREKINNVIRNLPAHPIVLKFEAGRYDFYPQSSNSYHVGLEIVKKDELIVDGNGASFIFHGVMSVAYVHGSRNITLKNFTVDWDRTFISQGRIINITENYVDVNFDKSQYPYIVEKDSIRFIGENSKLDIVKDGYSTIYNPLTYDIEYLTRDRFLSSDNSLFKGKVEDIGHDLVRFKGKVENKVQKNSLITLYHGLYTAPGIVLSYCKNMRLENITLYHVLGMGVLAERCENLYFNKVNIAPNRFKNRVFSGLADAFHLVSNKGDIRISNCTHEGQGDDFANVRGVYIPIHNISKDRINLDVEFHRSSKACYFDKGDSIWFVSTRSVQRVSGGLVTQVMSRKDKNGQIVGYSITLDKKVLKEVDDDFYVENATWNPNLHILNCHIGRRNRARGILVTTPGKVIIENNYFGTAGTAILIEGDIDYWYEAGAIRDMTIRNNVFDNCGTSSSKTGGKWEWGEAIITITPSFRPMSQLSPAYHKNIRIENNIIRSFDIPLLMARSVEGLSFVNNNVVRTYNYKPFAWQKTNIKLDGCRNVQIYGNLYSKDFSQTPVAIDNMKEEDFSRLDIQIK